MLVDQAKVKELLQDKWESVLSRGKPNKNLGANLNTKNSLQQ